MDLALNNQQRLICHKPKQTILLISSFLFSDLLLLGDRRKTFMRQPNLPYERKFRYIFSTNLSSYKSLFLTIESDSPGVDN